MSSVIEPKNPVRPADREAPVKLRQVTQILKSLAKLVGGKKIYAENNPRLARFRQEFHDKLNIYFKDEDELVLLIEQSTIKWSEEVVYENDKMDDSLAFLLYRDGVGEVTFEREIGKAEVDQFVDILTQEYHSREEDEDIVTKFWRADFQAISYRVLEDYLSSEFGEGSDKRKAGDSEESTIDFADHEEQLPSLEDKGRVIVEATDPMDTLDGYLNEIIRRTCSSRNPADLEQTYQTILESMLKLNENELTLGHEELRVETASQPLVAFMEGVLSFSLLSQNPSAVRDVLNVCRRLVEFVVTEGHTRAIMGMYTVINDFSRGTNIPDHVQQAIEEYQIMLTSDELLHELGGQLEQWSKTSTDTLEFFALMGPRSLPHLCQVLPRLTKQKAHHGVCDTILAVAGDDLEGAVEFLDIDNADVACDLIYLVRQAGQSAMNSITRELIHYPDARVKTEMINYLRDLEAVAAVPLLLKALSDPDKLIRLKVYEALGRFNQDDIRRKAHELAFGKDLVDRDMDEQEAIFKLLGLVGGEEAVELISGLLGKRHLLKFGKRREDKILAIKALENIRSQKALAILEKLTKDSNDQVKSRAGRAHDNLKKRLLAPAGE